MSWASATRKSKHVELSVFAEPVIEQHVVDWSRLVSLDFETYYDVDYTLSKLSTSEYIRDPRFEVLMCGVKVGNKPTVVVPGPKLRAYLAKINWSTHSLLCHNTQFDGFILSHHFGVKPAFTYCSLSMARGLYSNDIGAGLDEVSLYLGGKGKIAGGVEDMKGIGYKALFANKPLWARSTAYCAQDVEEMLGIFKQMLPRFPNDEIALVHLTNRMFTEPVLKVNIPRVEKELARELAEREALFLNVIDLKAFDVEPGIKAILKTKAERALTGKDRALLIVKRVIGSNEKFADLLRAEGIEPPVKISPAWIKKDADDRKDEDKWSYAFAKDDLDFINLPNDVEALGVGLDLNKKADIKRLAARQTRLQHLVDTRLAVKSTTNITRAERFLKAGANGMSLPCGYAYARAHTLRWGGNNKMNMQNLTRGGELRQSIEAPAGHVIAVSDSGQIEARVNGMLWGQTDLLDAFRAADEGTGRDAYCNFADLIYGRTITKDDKMERFVGKVCVLGLGFQMGAAKLQMTLAKGALGGPPVYFELDQCQIIISAYRRKNAKIVKGWEICKGIIEDMAAGRTGSHGPISWGKETVYLPNGLTLRYPDLRKRTGDKGWDEWTYQAKDIRKKLYGGLLCLAPDTEVLTQRGWIRLIEVRSNDKVWDGLNWVAHSGVHHMGRKPTMDFGGVRMTPDHEVLVNDTWIAAENTTPHEATSSFEKHQGPALRHADSDSSFGQRRTSDTVAGPVRLRTISDYVSERLPQGQFEELRLLDGENAKRSPHDARHVATPSLLCVAQHARSLQSADPPVVGAIRGTRNNSLREVDVVSGFLERHGPYVCQGTGPRPQEQHARVYTQELPLDVPPSQCPQYASTSANQYTPRNDALVASSGSFGHQQNDAQLSAQCGVAGGATVSEAEDVYDIINAGPLHRFTVRGTDGRPFLVHNCENVVQALARIIIGEQMLAVDKFARVVMTTHDEIVTLIKKVGAELVMRRIFKAMKTPPKWWPSIPLNCEGGFAQNYSK